MTARLKQPFRFALTSVELLRKLGLDASPLAMLSKPEHVRQANKPPRWMTRPGDRTVRTHELTIRGRGGPVRVRLYLPVGQQPGTPAILYLHGGGFVLGGLDGCDYLARGLASRTKLLVASVEYRLAPETVHPGPLDDCEDALRWLVETCPAQIDGSRVAVGGDSAGGNLAAALVLRMRDSDGPTIAHQSLLYPFLDGTISSADWDDYATGGVDRAAGRRMVELYAPNHDPKDPLLSPVFAPSLEGLPPTLVVTAEVDVLRADGRAYVDLLRAAGVPTVHREYARVPHGFVSMPRLCRDADECLDLVAAQMARALHRHGVSEPGRRAR